MSANADQITYWNEVAGPKWVANQAVLDAVLAPLMEALLAIAAPARGETALDIGCGCGALSLELATRIGSAGTVLGVDVSKPMLAHAAVREARARDAAVDGDMAAIRWQEVDASIEPFAPAHDLVTSRFGVMFFVDKPRAFANIRRAAKGGGRLAVIAWRPCAQVEWMQAPLDILAPVFPPAAESVDGVSGPFGLADADDTVRLLTEAGFRDVEAEAVDRTLTLGASVDEALALLLHTGRAAAAMREAAPDDRRTGERLLREALAERASPDGAVRMHGGCWVYRGRA